MNAEIVHRQPLGDGVTAYRWNDGGLTIGASGPGFGVVLSDEMIAALARFSRETRDARQGGVLGLVSTKYS